jgi:ATP-binding cassette subfamily C (CFTR/MRP) protein 4
MQMRIAVCGLIYRKSLKLNLSEHDSTGKIINMLSNDGTRIEFGFLWISYLIVSPLQGIAIIYLLLELVDLSILSGVLILLLIVPLQSVLGKVLNIYK